MADSLGTRLNGRQLLTRILAARLVLEKTLDPSEKRVGILLPPTAGAAIVNAALALMGRVAVNLNYTSSQSILETCIERAGIQHVISSPTFLSRVELELGNFLLDAADLRKRLTTVQKIQAWSEATLMPLSMLERHLGLDRIRPDDILTIIFTSGSTGDPKGVVLSIENVGSNVRAISDLLHLSPADTALGVLPFFHSYGYTTALWVPLMLEPAVAYHTNPLDAKVVGKLARDYHATVLMATPTFLRTYIRRTDPDDFSTLEAVFGAAEKLTTDVTDAFEEKFGVRPHEAYGATELSPLVAANVPPSRHVPGKAIDAREGTVGKPILGCTAKITDREGLDELPIGEEGLLWILGPNVMQGYLDRDDLTEQVIQEGWYRTGDIAKLDTDGFITITGRQSRFSKIGGEMVPHMLIEEAINTILGATDGELLAVVAAVPHATKGERLVVLSIKHFADPQKICRDLAQSGLPKLWIPSSDSFIKIEELPVLGSGKLDLRKINEIAKGLFCDNSDTQQ
jgi:acyl-[acyl-carrier-protein]-phospholipid O-acyltransferase/long-chain-fatty-acid--[acyl-carrier-protein] ligase